jgi:hypothetical protein
MATLPSPVGRLPPELLETMFLKVANKVTPNSSDSEDLQEPIYTCGLQTEILAFRGTSKVFREMSRRALAKVIGCTNFDLASNQSIRNL